MRLQENTINTDVDRRVKVSCRHGGTKDRHDRGVLVNTSVSLMSSTASADNSKKRRDGDNPGGIADYNTHEVGRRRQQDDNSCRLQTQKML